MVEVAANLVDDLIPKVPVRQWVLAIPKRIRPFIHNNPEIAKAVLKIFASSIEKHFKKSHPLFNKAKFGGVTFFQRFGSSLNVHPHYHNCIIDGLFLLQDNELIFHEVSVNQEIVESILNNVRKRVLSLFKRRRYLQPEEVSNMLIWDHGGGFSIDASVRIEAYDRDGLERLIRYCARPIFASNRLKWTKGHKKLIYESSKPLPNGRMSITLDPLELIEKLSLLIPPPRKHRHFYHGVLAPNSSLRKKVAAKANLVVNKDIKEKVQVESQKLLFKSRWAKLLARIYEVNPLICSNCGQEMEIIAFITTPKEVYKILDHIGEPTKSPPLSPARDPPGWTYQMDQTLDLMDYQKRKLKDPFEKDYVDAPFHEGVSNGEFLE